LQAGQNQLRGRDNANNDYEADAKRIFRELLALAERVDQIQDPSISAQLLNEWGGVVAASLGL
jgi:hypothetical protein